MLTEKILSQPDCSSGFDPATLTIAEARNEILNDIELITNTEKLSLRDSLGRYLAEDVLSPMDVPGHDNSAMDGYAINNADLNDRDAYDFVIAGTAFAGIPFSGTCKPGQCVKIMTGAPIPHGTNTVVMQEQTRPLGDTKVHIENIHLTGQNIRRRGEDIAKNSTVLAARHQITPADLGVIASLGISELSVVRRPRIAFFSTGDELRSLGERLGEGEIYDSNRYCLYGMLSRLNADIYDMGVVRDDPAALRSALETASCISDVIITSGGVSVGEADHIRPVLEEIGKMNFWKIAMKPGRPITYGRIGNSRFFGLPGNPVAVMVSFYQFVQPALQYLSSGCTPNTLTLQACCQSELKKQPGRYEFLRGYFTEYQPGKFAVQKLARQGSGVLTSMSKANCFILLSEKNCGVAEGDMVTIQPFSDLI